MPLDVPTRAHLVPEGVDAEALVGLLSGRLDLVAEPPATVESTVLDTVDRKVRDEQLDLRVEGARGSARLVLRDRDGALLLAADVPGADVSAIGSGPRFLAGDLPAGPLRDRLAPVVEERALLPLVRLRSETRRLRVLNADEKTVVRLTVTTPAALSLPDPARAFGDGPRYAPDGAVPLRSRLLVAGVLGYPRPLAHVREVVGDDLGLPEGPAGPADEAVRALDGDPRGLRTKVAVPLDPTRRTDRAAVAVLADLATIAESNLPGTIEDLDTEFLHDFRVAVRKSRSVLRELKGAFPAAELARRRDDLKWVQAVTGDTRDLDVQLLDWEGLVAKVDPSRRQALGPVYVLVSRRREEAFGRLRDELRDEVFTSRWAAYRAFLSDKLGPASERPDAKRPIAEVAGRRIRRVYGRMVTMGAAIDDDSPDEHLHDLRKRGKELRYLLELFGGLWRAETVKPMVKVLKSLQDVLGTHQDRAVQVAALRALSGDLATVPDGPEALLALGSLVDRLEVEQHEARDAFAARFAPFAAKAQRKLVDATFRAGTAAADAGDGGNGGSGSGSSGRGGDSGGGDSGGGRSGVRAGGGATARGGVRAGGGGGS